MRLESVAQPEADPGTSPAHAAAEPARRAACLRELAAARQHTDELFALIRPGALYDRAIAERHRSIFYIGHLEAFDWNLGRGHLDPGAAPEGLDRLFAFGIDPDPDDPQRLPADQPADWPDRAAVQRYSDERRRCFDDAAAQLPVQLLYVAIEHRLMHAETLCYLMHWLPLADKRPVAPPQPDPTPPPSAQGRAQGIEVPAGTAVLGLPRDGATFGWDNEFCEHREHVPAFRIDRYKVTNGDYLRFVQDGGPVPHFWIADAGGGFRLRCMFGEIPLPLAWPVYVTQEQAAAYAAWRGASLPTEAQLHRAACATPAGAGSDSDSDSDGDGASDRPYPWGREAPTRAHGCFDFTRWDPLPVDATPRGDSALGVSQLVGNGWEWTRTPFAPLPGWQPFPFYPGYSADFFDGQHFVVKGGSPRTAARLLRRSFRNFYRANYRYVYAGFRCVGP